MTITPSQFKFRSILDLHGLWGSWSTKERFLAVLIMLVVYPIQVVYYAATIPIAILLMVTLYVFALMLVISFTLIYLGDRGLVTLGTVIMTYQQSGDSKVLFYIYASLVFVGLLSVALREKSFMKVYLSVLEDFNTGWSRNFLIFLLRFEGYRRCCPLTGLKRKTKCCFYVGDRVPTLFSIKECTVLGKKKGKKFLSRFLSGRLMIDYFYSFKGDMNERVSCTASFEDSRLKLILRPLRRDAEIYFFPVLGDSLEVRRKISSVCTYLEYIFNESPLIDVLCEFSEGGFHALNFNKSIRIVMDNYENVAICSQDDVDLNGEDILGVEVLLNEIEEGFYIALSSIVLDSELLLKIIYHNLLFFGELRLDRLVFVLDKKSRYSTPFKDLCNTGYRKYRSDLNQILSEFGLGKYLTRKEKLNLSQAAIKAINESSITVKTGVSKVEIFEDSQIKFKPSPAKSALNESSVKYNHIINDTRLNKRSVLHKEVIINYLENNPKSPFVKEITAGGGMKAVESAIDLGDTSSEMHPSNIVKKIIDADYRGFLETKVSYWEILRDSDNVADVNRINSERDAIIDKDYENIARAIISSESGRKLIPKYREKTDKVFQGVGCSSLKVFLEIDKMIKKDRFPYEVSSINLLEKYRTHKKMLKFLKDFNMGEDIINYYGTSIVKLNDLKRRVLEGEYDTVPMLSFFEEPLMELDKEPVILDRDEIKRKIEASLNKKLEVLKCSFSSNGKKAGEVKGKGKKINKKGKKDGSDWPHIKSEKFIKNECRILRREFIKVRNKEMNKLRDMCMEINFMERIGVLKGRGDQKAGDGERDQKCKGMKRKLFFKNWGYLSYWAIRLKRKKLNSRNFKSWISEVFHRGIGEVSFCSQETKAIDFLKKEHPPGGRDKADHVLNIDKLISKMRADLDILIIILNSDKTQ